MKSAVPLLFALGLLLVPGRAAERPPMAHEMMGVANGCFVESVALLDLWQERLGADAWAKMLRWGAREDDEVVAGHAVAVCEARGRLWCYDINFGWMALSVDAAQKENVDAVVTPIVAKYPRIKAQFPSYFADATSAPVGGTPAALLTSPNAALRDVTIVAEKLARHRAVNVVTFTHGTGEPRQESAAAVFLYSGRYCIYAAERGTTPFRARGGVENLRLVRECLLRMFPGVLDVKKWQGPQ
ncbi:MAG: hypothetical protein HZA93_22875 [Verrucomicrobia bacterium]|nr:hypothetical protein [Verrucomicrobiota bacterium]